MRLHTVFLCLAAPDLDYEELDELLTFPANSTEGDELCVTITIINDNLVEHEEYFAISATGIGGLTQDAIFLLWHDYADVDIVDDDRESVIRYLVNINTFKLLIKLSAKH